MLKKKEILKFINQISKGKNMKYPLSPNSFSDDDIYQAAKVLFSKNITMGKITKNFEKALINDAFQTNDVEALNIVYDLIEKQKIVLGGSSGINIAGAIKLAKKLGPGKTIVTILCDHGKRYASKIFNKEFLKSKNLPIPKWL